MTRNYTNYNFQTLRNDVFMLAKNGDVTGNRIGPAQSSCAIHVSSYNINREVIYVLAAAIIAGSVIGYYLCGMLLDEMFAFRMSLGPLAAVVAGTTVILVTASTIGYQVYAAASANPVDSLRVE